MIFKNKLIVLNNNELIIVIIIYINVNSKFSSTFILMRLLIYKQDKFFYLNFKHKVDLVLNPVRLQHIFEAKSIHKKFN